MQVFIFYTWIHLPGPLSHHLAAMTSAGSTATATAVAAPLSLLDAANSAHLTYDKNLK